MPHKQLRKPLGEWSKHVSLELDQHSKIHINVNRRTDEGKEVSRKYVFRVSQSVREDMAISVTKKFNSGAHPPSLLNFES